MEPISQDKDNNFSTWEALKNDYLKGVFLTHCNFLNYRDYKGCLKNSYYYLLSNFLL